MKNNLVLIALVLFTLTLFAGPVLAAAPVKCKVVSVAGTTVTADCGKRAKKLQAGTSVTVQFKKKDGENCS